MPHHGLLQPAALTDYHYCTVDAMLSLITTVDAMPSLITTTVDCACVHSAQVTVPSYSMID